MQPIRDLRDGDVPTYAAPPRPETLCPGSPGTSSITSPQRRKRKYIQRSRIKASHIDAGEREESRTVDQYESIHVADFLSSVLGCVLHVENKTVVASLSVIIPVADAQCGPGDFHTDVFPIPASIEVVDAADPWAQFFHSGRIDVQKGIETPGTGSAPLLSAASARLGEQAMVTVKKKQLVFDAAVDELALLQIPRDHLVDTLPYRLQLWVRAGPAIAEISLAALEVIYVVSGDRKADPRLASRPPFCPCYNLAS